MNVEGVGEMRILVVDDDAVILESLEIFLESVGYTDVKFARSGEVAMQMIAANPLPFECILLDINMPEMTGIEFLSEVRQMKTYEYVPVIMLTALGDRARIKGAFAAGAWDYIVKPFEAFELQARIKSAAHRNIEIRRLTGKSIDQSRTIEFPKKLRNVARDIPDGGMMGGGTLKNCFTSRLRQTPARLGVLTMIVDCFDVLSHRLAADEFDQYLTELARQLTTEFTKMHSIISYQGDGVFMALSFAFDELDEVHLEQAAMRAVNHADAQIQDPGLRSTRVLVGRVLSQELPENIEPIYMLEMVKARLLSQGSSAP